MWGNFLTSWGPVTFWRRTLLQRIVVLVVVSHKICRFLWPCIVSKLWSEIENQQDATVRCLLSILSQHISGIIMPIFRRTRRVLLHNTAPHNRYQPHPAEPAQHTTCSNTRLVLLKMGIMMPETCWESIDNKHLTVASCWFSISLHNLLTMHCHRNLKLKKGDSSTFEFLVGLSCLRGTNPLN